MTARSLIVLIFFSYACVDRLEYDLLKNSGGTGIVVEGFISDSPGPHTVKITRAFPIGKIDSVRAVPFSAEKVTVIDNHGNQAVMTQVAAGIYQTTPNFKGVVNDQYKLRVEFKDATIFESKMDTLFGPGELDSIYFSFSNAPDDSQVPQFVFDVFADATLRGRPAKYFSWSMIGTYKAITDASCDVNSCNFNFQQAVCNWAPLCSGVINLGSTRFPRFERVSPCSCCTCWYQFFNEKPMISSDFALNNVKRLKVGIVPINSFTFTFKTNVEVQLRSLSAQTHFFWKRVIEQKVGAESLFQPVTGKVPTSFNQVAGKPVNISGIFYATSIKKKSFYLTRENIPNPDEMAPKLPTLCLSCLILKPNSTTIKPAFWVD